MSDIHEQLRGLGNHWAYEGKKAQAFADSLWDDKSITLKDFDAVSTYLAKAYDASKISYEDADALMNDVWSALVDSNVDWNSKTLSFQIYKAFDAGEYYRTKDQSDDPIKEHAEPAIARIVAELSDNKDASDNE